MAGLRRALLLIALIVGAVPLARASDNPPPFPNSTQLKDDAQTRLSLVYYYRMSLDKWIKRAKNDAALCYYSGSVTDYRHVAGYLVETQFIPKDPDDPDPRRGSWKGDNREAETFDEGGQGKSIAVLALMIDRYGDNWVFRNNNGELRTMGQALRDALDCAYRCQYKPEDGGIAGPWPESPGWREGNVKVPGGMTHENATRLASLRTYNDGASSEIVDGMAIFRILFDDDEGRIDDAILSCAEGTWQIAAANEYAVPEQCNPDGTPAWGRGHEPPSLSSRSTGYAMEIFMAAHAISGDRMWLDRADRLDEWLDRHEVHRGEWEHYLEPGSDRPIWGDGYYNIVRKRSRAHWPSAKFGALQTYPVHSRTRLRNYENRLTDFTPSDPPSPPDDQGQDDQGQDDQSQDGNQTSKPSEPERNRVPVNRAPTRKATKPPAVIRPSGGGTTRQRKK